MRASGFTGSGRHLRESNRMRNSQKAFALAPVLSLWFAANVFGATCTVPATTAYFEPDSRSLRMTGEGVSGWRDPKSSVVWFGWLGQPGEMSAAVTVKLPSGATAGYSLSISAVRENVQGTDSDATSLNGKITGTGEVISVRFGAAKIDAAGYHRFELRGLENSGSGFGEIRGLELAGDPVEGAQFNQTRRRNAASVHLWFPVRKGSRVQAFYNELTVDTDPIWSYYMACGFHRGYFGIQVNSPTERRIIFSVWDSGNEGIDRNRVKPEDQVQLLGKGEGVVAHGFGNEGTGGHSHLVYPWKKGDTYRFLVTAEPEGKHTTFSGYFFFPEKRKWGLIASFRAPKDGGFLRGLYSFSENFVGHNGHLLRRGLFGNQWVRREDGTWRELTSARFTHDGHGREQRKDYHTGVRDGKFFLQHGGFLPERSSYGRQLERPRSDSQPEFLRGAPFGFTVKQN